MFFLKKTRNLFNISNFGPDYGSLFLSSLQGFSDN